MGGNEMTKAEELFKNLGYKKIKDDEDLICYILYREYRAKNIIRFTKKSHKIKLGGIKRYWWIVNSDLQNAIIQQMKELKWIE